MRIRNKLWIIRALIPSLRFNFRYLPLRQAVKLPILVYKPHFRDFRGKVRIEGPVSFGMIRLGVNVVSIYPSDGIYWDVRGEVVFRGRCTMGNGVAVSVGDKGRLDLGAGCRIGAASKVVCYHLVRFAEDVRTGWECLFTDTDFHSVILADGSRAKGYGPIDVARNVWFATGCRVYKNTRLPEKCIVASNTILHKPFSCPPSSLIANGRSIEVKAKGVWRNLADDEIEYQSYEEIPE